MAIAEERTKDLDRAPETVAVAQAEAVAFASLSGLQTAVERFPIQAAMLAARFGTSLLVAETLLQLRDMPKRPCMNCELRDVGGNLFHVGGSEASIKNENLPALWQRGCADHGSRFATELSGGSPDSARSTPTPKIDFAKLSDARGLHLQGVLGERGAVVQCFVVLFLDLCIYVCFENCLFVLLCFDTNTYSCACYVFF